MQKLFCNITYLVFNFKSLLIRKIFWAVRHKFEERLLHPQLEWNEVWLLYFLLIFKISTWDTFDRVGLRFGLKARYGNLIRRHGDETMCHFSNKQKLRWLPICRLLSSTNHFMKMISSSRFGLIFWCNIKTHHVNSSANPFP